MSFEYIANTYGKTFKKGQIVKVTDTSQKPPPPWKLGVVVKATHHVFVRLDGAKHELNDTRKLTDKIILFMLEPRET